MFLEMILAILRLIHGAVRAFIWGLIWADNVVSVCVVCVFIYMYLYIYMCIQTEREMGRWCCTSMRCVCIYLSATINLHVYLYGASHWPIILYMYALCVYL